VEQIRDAGHRAAGLTRQLLAVSRRQLLRPRVVSLNTTVQELEPMLQRLLGTDVNLESQLQPELGTILVDPAQVEQALVNLILTARDALPAGGRVGIVTADVELDEEPYVSISVSDTGVGIDKELLPHVFDYYRRGTDASTARCEGLGLGLAIVREIVTQHGGTVDAQSSGDGQGATFLVLLPLCDCGS
jgi:signal transduction histidine kinase